MTQNNAVLVPAPKFGESVFTLQGTAPLVIHRMSKKLKQQMTDKMTQGKSASSKKNREAKDLDNLYQESKYVSPEGWEGVHAGAFRKAMISACRLVNFKMVLAKLSVFIEADGWDKEEPQIPLVRVFGKSIRQEDIARVETGQPYITVRAAYHKWEIKLRVRWDLDQFSAADIANLLMRAGQQVGIGEGRPDSKNSAGMGWGLFKVVKSTK